MDETDFMGRTLKVAISAPPSSSEKSAPFQSSANRNFPSTSSSRPFIPRADQKSRISFVPASVQKASSTTSNDQPTAAAKPAMSNDDFRKMLMK